MKSLVLFMLVVEVAISESGSITNLTHGSRAIYKFSGVAMVSLIGDNKR